MSTGKLFTIITFIYLCGFFVHSFVVGKTVYGDGVFYYSWVRSMVVDHDIDFANEYKHFGVQSFVTPNGLSANKYGIGPALIWLPVFNLTHAVVQGDGYGFPYQFAVGLVGVIAAITGLVFVYLSVNRSVYVTLTIALATNLLFYGSLDTVNSHAVGFLASASLVYILTKQNAFLAGLAVGFLASVRLQDGIFVLLLIPLLKQKSLYPGLLLGFLPQIITRYLLYGPVLNPYGFEGETFNFLHPHLLEVFFAGGYGLIVTPILIIALFYLRSYPLLVVLLQIYLISSWSTWWQGATFAPRMLVSGLPLIALGLEKFFLKKQFKTLQLIFPLIILNFILIINYLYFH